MHQFNICAGCNQANLETQTDDQKIDKEYTLENETEYIIQLKIHAILYTLFSAPKTSLSELNYYGILKSFFIRCFTLITFTQAQH